MSDLAALAERVEQAEGPDFDLDCEIAVKSGAYVRESRGRDRQTGFPHSTYLQRLILEIVAAALRAKGSHNHDD